MEADKLYIVIRGTGVISPMGHDAASVAAAYSAGTPAFSTATYNGETVPVAALPATVEAALQELIQSNASYKQLDRSVLLAIYAARQAATEAGWLQDEGPLADDLGVNIGSSRGATGLFEHHYEAYQRQALSSGASPTTTLGNLSSWVAHAVHAGGAQISHSITCSTALMAIANGAAWLKAGMARRFLVGGTEAPLTPFTVAQMQAIGIYSKLANHPYPCQPYALERQNTFVLGEGAAVFALEQVPHAQLKAGDMVVEAIGLGFEKITSKTGISAEGLNFQKSMRHALAQLPEQDRQIDLIMTHTPGTRTGDSAELAAIAAVFGPAPPTITTNKWLIGHTLGASGALSLEYALHILRHQQLAAVPYPNLLPHQPQSHIGRILVNAAGFGGNASSVIVRCHG